MKKQDTQNLIQELQTKIINFAYPPAEARSITFLLLEHLLHLKKEKLLSTPTLSLSKEQNKTLNQYLIRLKQKEPVQHLIGYANFYDRPFKVNPHVLIPRPETEELVHLIIQKHQHQKKLKILDLGTGSACIAITLAKELPSAQVSALDNSLEALNLARENAQNLGADIRFLHADLFTHSLTEAYDIYVSNPPYVLLSEQATMARNVLDYEPHQALFVPDEQALIYYTAITESICQFPGRQAATLYFEINEAYGQPVEQLLLDKGFENTALLKDLFGKDRFVSGELHRGPIPDHK